MTTDTPAKQTGHTPITACPIGPWSYEKDTDGDNIDCFSLMQGLMWIGSIFNEDDAKAIVADLNAMQGIATGGSAKT